MPRYKPVHKGLKLLPVDFERQVQPGRFEYALCYLVDHELDLAAFHARYKNDDEGAPAFNPAVLIKIVLLASAAASSPAARSKQSAARTCCSSPSPVIPSRTTPPWPPSSPTWVTWPPSCLRRC